MHDTDCPTGEVCACHEAPYANGQGNTCMPGNCRVDSDCGPGGYCSPSFAPMGCGGLGGYYCHTPADQCVNDNDCTGSNGPSACSYSSSAKAWHCVQVPLCA
jgi:hypothetical protein